MNLKQLLEITIDRKASDLHLIVGTPPFLRVNGVLLPVPNEPILTPDTINQIISSEISTRILKRLNKLKEVDFSLSFNQKARFRVNAYTQKNTFSLAIRRIPLEIPSIDELHLPKILHSVAGLKQGLILVTGPTGHGKSTTLASTINEINSTRAVHIVTIEDPVEFVFRPIKSIISQREMGIDTDSWPVALKSVLREDPDVVLVGEMRDLETIAATITVAETGHLVFATLHTNSAAQSIDRIVDVFPDEQQSQIRLQLSNVIEVVLSQRLVPTISGPRTVAHELMLATPAIKTLIREGKTHQIDNVLQTSHEVGMNTLETSLASLVRGGTITLETARSYTLRPNELNRLVRTK